MPTEHNRRNPLLQVTVLMWQSTALKRMAHASGLSLSRIVREIITFAITRGYTPGSVSATEIGVDARASIAPR